MTEGAKLRDQSLSELVWYLAGVATFAPGRLEWFGAALAVWLLRLLLLVRAAA